MKDSPMLTANLYVERDYFGFCTIIGNRQQMGFLHKHNYYEVFLVIDGNAQHEVNGERYTLERGSLVLMRPDDEHCYAEPISENYQFINFILTQELFQSIAQFLGSGIQAIVNQNASSPEVRILSGPDYDNITKTLERLMLYPRTDVEGFNTSFKFAAVELLNVFFRRVEVGDDASLPLWLRQLIKELYKEEHYTRGLPAMYEISQYSPAHLCRIFQKYLHTSPTAFLTGIRLKEAAKRLIYTDEDIIEIASGVGFDNLSYFYRRFKAWYGLSPRKYRQVSKNVPAYPNESFLIGKPEIQGL